MTLMGRLAKSFFPSHSGLTVSTGGICRIASARPPDYVHSMRQEQQQLEQGTMRSNRLPAIICAAFLPLSVFATPLTYEFSGIVDGGIWDDNTPPELTPFIPWGTA